MPYTNTEQTCICDELLRLHICLYLKSISRLAFSLIYTLIFFRKMEGFLRAMGLENLSQTFLEILVIQKMVCNRLHQITDCLQDNARRVDPRLSFRLFYLIQELCRQMAARNLRVRNLETKDLLCLQILMQILPRMNRFHLQF